MSTIRKPVGPQPSNVYWRRRLLVGLGLLAVIIVILLIVFRPGSGKPSAVHTPTGQHTSSPAATVKPCKRADLSVVAVTDALGYAASVNPMLSLSITNTGSTACSFKDGSDVQEYVITSGSEKIWSSKDCQKNPQPATTTLKPNIPVTSTPFAWDRTRSSTTTCASTTLPKVVAGGASYHLSVTVNGVKSKKSKQFVLQ